MRKIRETIGLCCGLWAALTVTPITMPASAAPSSRVQAVAMVKKAEAAFYGGDYNAAIALCRNANRVDPTYVRAYTWLGATSEKRGDEATARQAYRKILILAPQSPDARHARLRLSRLPVVADTNIDLASTNNAPRSNGEIRIFVNNRALNDTSAPLIRRGRVLVPLRAVVEELGAVVNYNVGAKTIVAQRGDSLVRMSIGRRTASVNQRRVRLETPPVVVRGATMVPLRFVAEAMGAQVAWNGRDIVKISTAGRAPTVVAAAPRIIDTVESGASLPTPATINLPPQAPVVPDSRSPVKKPPGAPPIDETEGESVAERWGPPRPTPQPPAQPVPDNSQKPNQLGASSLLTAGRLRQAPEAARVLGRAYPQAFVLSEQDADLTFQLNKEWQWFEAQMAVADDAPSPVAEIDGWFDGMPQKRAFKNFRFRSKRAPVTVRIRVSGATQLTLAPLYPGYPVLIINPRFVR